MSVFKLPVGVANRLEKLQRDFFWGDGINKKKVHSVNWVTLCLSKKNGGLGIGRMLAKNRSLLAKWAWRFGTETDTLWKQVLCAKYKVDPCCFRWSWQSKSQVSHFVKAVGSLFEKDSITENSMVDGFKVILST